MTAAQLKSILSIIPPVESVFASGASERSEIKFTDANKRIAYDSGIPKDPYAKDLTDGGKHVLLKDINAVANVATTGIFLRQNGGTNEFDTRVIDIDAGTKQEEQSWGYPYGAIIDWWDSGSSNFKKIMCVKTGGNCTIGPDDSTHGIAGGDPYWIVVNQMERKRYVWTPSSWSDTSIVTYSDGVYTFQTMCRAFLKISYNIRNNHGGTNVSTSAYTFLPIVARKGDTLSISYTTVTFNGTPYDITPSIFTTYKSYVIVSGIVITPDSISKYTVQA